MTSRKCVWINAERLEQLQGEEVKTKIGGLDLNISISPYDLPRALVGEYQEDPGYFNVFFEYIDDEPEVLGKKAQHNIEIFVGKYSAKILRIAIPIDYHPFDRTAVIQLRGNILDALNEMCGQSGRGQQNRRAAKDLVDEKLDELVSALG